MKRATVSDLKNQLSRFLRLVKSGETVVVLERGLPVAELHPRSRRKDSSSSHLDVLEDRGIIRRGDTKKILSFSSPSGKSQTGVLEALLEERRDGR